MALEAGEGFVSTVAGWVVAALLAIINILLGKTVASMGRNTESNTKRLNEIDKSYVSRQEFNDTVKGLRGEIKGIGDKVDTGVNGVHTRLDRMLELQAGKQHTQSKD